MEKTPPTTTTEPTHKPVYDQEGLAELISRHGTGFYAYLQITDPAQETHVLDEGFLARYRGCYYNFEDFARTRLTQIGAHRLSQELGVEVHDGHPDDIYLTAAHLRRLYDAVTIDSYTYVFQRHPHTPQALPQDAEPLQIDPLIHPPTPRIEISAPGLIGPQPQTRRELRTLQRLYETFNTAFEVYLNHIWAHTPIDELEEDMLNVYQGSYPSVAAFIDTLAEALDWTSAIKKTVQEMVIPPGAVGWNYHALYHDLTRDFEFHQLGGRVHVFHK